MPDWTDLKAEIASCWKVSWNVEPLALSVPLRAAPPDEEDAPPLDEEPAGGVGDVELAEGHADRPSAVAMTATPTVATCCLRRRCISGYSFWDSSAFGRDEQPRAAGQPANRGVRVR